MGISVKMTPGVDEIQRFLEKEVGKNVQRLIKSLQYVGEQVVNGIRDGSMSNWNDRTGNLRSSIGYIVSVDGVPQNISGFEQVDGPQREEGFNANQSRNYAQTLASLYPRGIALIVVAGMEYASYVEAMENKTVLAQGEIEARTLIEEMIRELNSRYSSDKD